VIEHLRGFGERHFSHPYGSLIRVWVFPR